MRNNLWLGGILCTLWAFIVLAWVRMGEIETRHEQALKSLQLSLADLQQDANFQQQEQLLGTIIQRSNHRK